MHDSERPGKIRVPLPVPSAEDEPEGFIASLREYDLHYRVTALLLLVNVGLFIAMWRAGNGDVSSVAVAFGSKVPSLIREGEIWRFVTPIFLHGSLIHLFTNALSLVLLGVQMETLYGSRKYLLVYLIAGIAGNVASYLLSPYPSLGASGAIFGLIGAGLVFPIRFRSLVPQEARSKMLSQLLGMAALNLGIGFVLPHVDNWAHMGGMVGGAFAALFLLPETLDDRPKSRPRETLLWAATAVAVAIIGWAGISQWRFMRLVPPEPQMVGPAGNDAWWSVSVPPDWKRVGNRFYSPKNAVLVLSDTVQTPQEIAAMVQVVQQSGRPVSLMQDGNRRIARVLLQEPKQWTDITLISNFHQALGLTLQCRPNVYTQIRPELEFILTSAHIYHDPIATKVPPQTENSPPPPTESPKTTPTGK